jgi:hypothetical protein
VIIKKKKEVLSPLKKIIISVKIINKKHINPICFIFFSNKKIPSARSNGNNLDKKLPTIISSPKKLDKRLEFGEVIPNIFDPKKN